MLPFHMHRSTSYYKISHGNPSEETIRQSLLSRRHSHRPQYSSAMAASKDTAQPTAVVIERCISNGIGGAGNLRKPIPNSVTSFIFAD